MTPEEIEQCKDYFLQLFPDNAIPDVLLQDLLNDYNAEECNSCLSFIKNFEKQLNPECKVLLVEPLYILVLLFRCFLRQNDITVFYNCNESIYDLSVDEKKYNVKNSLKLSWENRDWVPPEDGYQIIISRVTGFHPDILKTLAARDSILVTTNNGELAKWEKDRNGLWRENELEFTTFEYHGNPWTIDSISYDNILDNVTTNLQQASDRRHQILTECSSSTHEEFFASPPSIECQSSSMSLSYLSKISKSLENESECPVCFNILSTPIQMCSSGHNICGVCCESMNACPICEATQFSRNLSLEKIFEYLPRACQGNVNGCDKVLVASVLEVHQLHCKFVQKKDCSCGEQVLLVSYRSHVIDAHPITTSPSFPLKYEKSFTQNDFKDNNEEQDLVFFKTIDLPDVFEVKLVINEDDLLLAFSHIGEQQNTFKYKIDIHVDFDGDSCCFQQYPVHFETISNPTFKIPVSICKKNMKKGPFTLSCFINKI